MKRYDNYKDSGVEWIGEVPGHWEVKRFKYCFNFVNDKSETDLPKIGLEHVESWTGNLIENDVDFEGEGTYFKPNDILFGKLRPYLAKVHLSKIEGKAVGDFFIFRPTVKIFPKYGQLLILSKNFIEITNSSTFGSKMPRVSPDFFNELKTIIPPFEEQTAIATYLDRKTAELDALIADKKRLLELYEEEKTALINQAVTKGIDPDVKMKDSGVAWLGEVPEGWEVKKLKFIVNEMVSGPFGSSLKKEIYTESGYKVYGQEQVIKGNVDYGDYYISEETYHEMSRYKISSNDILISCVGTFGKILLVPEKFEEGIINPRLIKVTPNVQRVHPSYLNLILKSSLVYEQLEALSRGGTMGVINLDLLKQLILPLPEKNEQTTILAHIEAESARIAAKQAKTEKLIALLTEYRTALVSEVVTGKVRVV